MRLNRFLVDDKTPDPINHFLVALLVFFALVAALRPRLPVLDMTSNCHLCFSFLFYTST